MNRHEVVAPEAQLRALSAELGLPVASSQDWGIENADGGRVVEFVRYWKHHPLARTADFYMFELVLASANERLLGHPGDELEEVERCLGDRLQDAQFHLRYWASLKDRPLEFPVARWALDRFVIE